ncbi:hypothetical protein AB0B94_30595 [Micromonospora sp. NPDC048986]|uniref:hypothetical protein n=1 Tax=Micromonospora sp. NPDC048986 TaxID=3155644 RepID=UPI0033ECD156
MTESDIDYRPADYVRVEIRRGDETTVYELAADPGDPISISRKLDVHTRDVSDGVLTRTEAGPAYLTMNLNGRMTTGTVTRTGPPA